MTDNNEEVLRRSLDAVDRHRRRLLIGLVVLGAVMLAMFSHASAVVHSGSTNAFIHATFVLLMIWTTLLAVAVTVQITVMTKRILRAIELASRK